jgi:hypothetical protein
MSFRFFDRFDVLLVPSASRAAIRRGGDGRGGVDSDSELDLDDPNGVLARDGCSIVLALSILTFNLRPSDDAIDRRLGEGVRAGDDDM